MSAEFRIRALKWQNPDGTLEVPTGCTLVIGRWVPIPGAAQMGVNAAPAVMEYRNRISGPTNWTVINVVPDES